jgi:hypothetical protein
VKCRREADASIDPDGDIGFTACRLRRPALEGGAGMANWRDIALSA